MAINECALRETFYGFIQIFSRDAAPSCHDRSDTTPNWRESIGTCQGTEKSCKRYVPWTHRPRNVVFVHFKLLSIFHQISQIYQKIYFFKIIFVFHFLTTSTSMTHITPWVHFETSNAVEETCTCFDVTSTSNYIIEHEKTNVC